MTESEIGNPAPLLLKVSIVPLVPVTTTVKDEMDEVAGMFALMP
jgi:hypothetical protein